MKPTAIALSFLAPASIFAQTPPASTGKKAEPIAQGLGSLPPGPPNLSPQFELPIPPLNVGRLHREGDSPMLGEVNREFASKPLRLLDAVSVAMTFNPRLAKAGQSVLFYQGRVAETRSALGPALSITPGETLIHHISDEAYGIQATIPIDISHLLSTATKQAQFEQIGARLDVNRIRNEVVYSVDQAFFDVLRAQALVTVSKTNLQNSFDRLHDAQVRYHAEAVAYLDVLRAQTDEANAEHELIRSQTDVSRAISNLSTAMGVNPDSSYTISSEGSIKTPPGVQPPTHAPVQPNISSPNPRDLVPAPSPESIQIEPHPESAEVEARAIAKTSELGPEYQQIVAEAIKTRPEILEADAQTAAAKQGIILARRSLLPTLQVGLGYFDERSVTGARYNEPQGFIGLSIPLSDSGLARSRVAEAQSLVEQQEISRRQVFDSVKVDVQNAYYNLVESRSQVSVANQALAQAQAAFDLARIRYNTGVSSRPGVSPLIEVSDAQVALTLAEQNQVNALYNYNVAKAQLDRSIGRFSFVLNENRGFKKALTKLPVDLDKP